MRGEVIELGIAHAPVERRAYTEFRVSAAVAEAAGAAVRGAAFGAVEIAAGMFARAFAAAEVEPAGARTSCLTPLLLASMARRLLTAGEALAVIEVDPAGAVELREAVSWDVRGGPAACFLELHRHHVRAIFLAYRSRAGRGSRACAVRHSPGRVVARSISSVNVRGYARAGWRFGAASRARAGRASGPVDSAATGCRRRWWGRG